MHKATTTKDQGVANIHVNISDLLTWGNKYG